MERFGVLDRTPPSGYPSPVTEMRTKEIGKTISKYTEDDRRKFSDGHRRLPDYLDEMGFMHNRLLLRAQSAQSHQEAGS